MGETSGRGDSINIGAMASYAAWKRFADACGWEWFQPWIEPQWAAWFCEILKQSEDSPILFTHGKWASIQVLEGKVCAAAACQRFSNIRCDDGGRDAI